MTVRHTRGPWTVGALDHNDQRRVGSDTGRLIAVCAHECVTALEVEMEANARLIAAAPDLLAMCIAVIPLLDGDHDGSQQYEDMRAYMADQIRAAIKKTNADCPECKGSGETTAMTQEHGPDDYEVTITCPKCNGEG